MKFEDLLILTSYHRDGSSFVVINVYCPRVDRDKPERLTYKLNFFSAIEQRARSFIQRGWYTSLRILLFSIYVFILVE